MSDHISDTKRSFIEPPSVELAIRRSPANGLLVCAPDRQVGVDNDKLLHDINLLLDVAGECEILTQDLVSPIGRNLRRLNWEVLPRGNLPWQQLEPLLSRRIENLSESARAVVLHRLKVVSGYRHNFVAVGRAGFSGYVVFGFPELAIYVLECTHEGNATYVFGNDWEELYQWSKAEVLQDDRHLHRLIHARGWQQRLAELMRQHGYRDAH